MIKAVFFDFYNTLVRFWPPVEDIQIAACREMGLMATREGIQEGYGAADAFFNQENSRSSLARRSKEGRDQFFARYEQLILKGAGLDVSLDLARRIWELTTLVPKSFVPFDDVVPALKALKGVGLTLGVLSNLDRDMGALAKELGLKPYLDFCITSREVGAEKPHPPIFLAALARAGVSPEEAAHVGDQVHSDVEGARAVGIMPVLLDRESQHLEFAGCRRVRSLGEVKAVVGRSG
jgi:putative hydrolase of the HAD superfamily